MSSLSEPAAEHPHSWPAVLALAVLVGSVANANREASAVGVLGACLLCRSRISLRVALLGLAVLAFCATRAQWAHDTYAAQLTTVAAAFKHPVRCEIQGTIDSQPQWHGASLGFYAVVQTAECTGVSLPEATRIRLYGGPEDLARGDQFSATAEVSVVQLFRNQDVISPLWQATRAGALLSGGILRLDRKLRAEGLSACIDRARAYVRTRIEATYVPLATPLAKALVLGESDLSEEDDTAFKLSGLAHLLAVSGSHLVLAVGGIVAALRAVLVRLPVIAARCDVRRPAALVGIPISLLYADFAGGSGSALRAAWMLSVVYLWTLLGRQATAQLGLTMSILIGVLRDPLLGFDLSFMLSVSATLGLVRLGPLFRVPLSQISHPGFRFLCSNIATTLSAMLPCSAMLALLCPELSPVSVVANAIAAPFGEAVALPLCLTHALSGLLPDVERGLALVASGALLVVRRVALWSAAHKELALPLALPSAWHYVGLGWLLITWLSLTSASLKRLATALPLLGALAFLVAAERSVREHGSPRDVLRVTALDVGQGDATLVDLPDGCAVLIDGGGFVGSPIDPGKRVLLPVLRARRRSHLDVVVLSHPHPDHFGGLAAVLNSVSVGELWDTGEGERSTNPAYLGLLATARARGVRVRRPAELCGVRPLCGASIEVLAPCPAPRETHSTNDNSFVIRIQHGQQSALLVGDAEAAEENELLAVYGSRLHSDLLKVGHHGSRTSSSGPFLDAVSPEVATISCGMRNSYGHPHPEALERISLSVPVLWRTDLSGSAIWESDGSKSTLHGFKQQPQGRFSDVSTR